MNREMVPPLVVATALVTYRGARSGSNAKNPVAHLPLPSQVASVFLVFGTLSLFSGNAARPAVLAGWGLNVAILLNLWKPGTTPNQLTTAQIQNLSSTTTAKKVVTKK